MRAQEILDHFRGLVDTHELKINPETSCDGIVCGDPQKRVDSLLVCWMNTAHALEHAIAGGYDMMICHEASMWGPEPDILDKIDGSVIPVTRPGQSAPDTVMRWDPGTANWKHAEAKRARMEASGLVVMRLHDVWDLLPQVGIPWALARFLEIPGSPSVRGGDYGEQHRYEIDPVPVGELARRIAAKTARIGEPAVQLFGDPAKVVTSIGIGTGCGASILVYHAMGCGTAVICDDTWESRCFLDIAFAMDTGFPLIRINHGTSEEPGMASLAEYLQDRFARLEVDHLVQGSCFRLVGSVETGTLRGTSER